MAKIAEATLASAFLVKLHAPDNALMRKAVVVWMRHESGSTIVGNNPFNLRPGAAAASGVKPCGSRHSLSSGDFAVFCSPTDGAEAAAGLLISGGNDWRGYGRVVKAARAGDPIKFLDALARSAWSGSRYGGPKHNNLLKDYAKAAGLGYAALQAAATNSSAPSAVSGVEGTATALPTGNVLGSQGVVNGYLGAWYTGPDSPLVNFPVGHVLTAADVQFILAALESHGFFDGPLGEISRGITANVLISKIGQPWSPTLLRSIQSALFTSANEATPKTPLDPLFAIAGSIAQIVGAIFDPYKWLLVLSLIAGVAMTAFGGINIARAAA